MSKLFQRPWRDGLRAAIAKESERVDDPEVGLSAPAALYLLDCADALTTIALAAGLGADATAAEVAARVGSLGVIAGLRRDGWAVAVHNDYRLAGKSHTFWLFTKGDRAVKGEGETDEEALGQIARRLAEEAGRG